MFSVGAGGRMGSAVGQASKKAVQSDEQACMHWKDLRSKQGASRSSSYYALQWPVGSSRQRHPPPSVVAQISPRQERRLIKLLGCRRLLCRLLAVPALCRGVACACLART